MVRRMPPWPWTIGLGSPVVPLEYKIQIGWSKGSHSGSKAWTSASSRDMAVAQSASAATDSAANGVRSTSRLLTLGNASRNSRTTLLRSIGLPP